MSNQCLLKYCKYSKEFYIISFDLAVWQLQLFYEVTRANRKKKKKKPHNLDSCTNTILLDLQKNQL